MTTSGLPDCRYLVSARDARDRLGEATLLDLRPAEDYAVGHIEGARPLDLYGVSLNDTSEAPMNAFFALIRTLLGSRGVTRERPVIVYDHESGERAARAVWLLAALGHPDARILDGGTQAWTDSGQRLVRLESAPPPVDPAKAPPTASPLRGAPEPALIATRFDVQKAIGDAGSVILDVRRASEYLGSEKRARRAGTIPGAVHVFWREHLDAKGAFRPAAEIRALYESKGVTPDKDIIAVCHGGYRSANSFLALKSLGYPRVRNYLGAWAEWGNREDTQVVVPSSARSA
ncbi:MAG: sulfurtransferase [Burkholderiales bacterium]